MAAAAETIKISLEFSDSGAAAVVKKLESSFRGLTNAAEQLDSQGISKVRDRIKNFDTAGKRNISTIQSQIGALKALRNEAQIGSTQFKQLTADISRYSQELQKAEGRKRSGGRLAGVAKGVGAIAAAGVFGGPEGAIGAGIGALVGGPVGAAVGGAIGAQVGQIRQALGATAEYAATLTKLRIALKGVTSGQAEYQEGLSFIQQTTKEFAVPQEVVTRQFTKLQASVSGAGGDLEDTKKAFNGIVAAVRATGGSLADVDSALTATAQVFSKGKVSAEELRQQLGERLPGAFTLFAESVGMTPQELDKALEGGKVTLQDFQIFAEKLFDKYGETAKKIADSPEAAGDRLKVALDSLSENVGELLKPIGASFQETFINIVEFIDMATGRLKLFLELGATGTRNKVHRLSADITRLLKKQEEFNRIDREAGTSVIRPSDRRMVEHQLEQKREQLQSAQSTLRSLTGFNVVAEPPEKKGLPGGGTTTEPDGGGTTTEANKDKSLIARSKELLRIQTASLNVAEAQNQTEKLLSQQLNNRVKLKEQFNKLLADVKGVEAEDLIKENQKQALEAQRQKQKQIFDQQNQQVIDKALKGVNDIVAKNKEKLETDKEYKRLLMEGIEPSQARQIIALNKQFKLQDEILKKEIETLRALLLIEDLGPQARQNILDRIAATQGARGTLAESAQQGIQDIRDNPPEQKSFLEKLGSEADEIEKKLKKLIDPANQVIGAANAIGDAFSKSFMSVIKGEVSARQALANFFSSVANHFADMAAKIIAEAIKMQAIQFITQIVSAFVGAAVSGGGSAATPATTLPGSASQVGSGLNIGGVDQGIRSFGPNIAVGAEGAYLPGGLKPFADGGMVSQPTLGLVGEAGENEYIIPQSKMRTAMARYSRGVRGPGVIPGNGDDVAGEPLAGAAIAPIDVRYTVERINSIDYVTADQFQTGMQQAAQQGAKQGEQQTLKRLQMSGSTRRRLGL